MEAIKQIKGRLYKLIERSEDENLLEVVYQILNQEYLKSNEKISLTEQQEQELLEAYKESFIDDNLIDHKTLMDKNAKWLGK